MISAISHRRRARVRYAVATALAAAIVAGLASPAAAAPADAIAPHPDAWGRYFVDSAGTNITANKTPATNAAIGLLSPMLKYWAPDATPVPAVDANGKYIPTSVGTIIDQAFHDANIAEAARITQTRTSEQAADAYRIDRRNQNYSAIAGLGPWTQAFTDGSGAGTTIPDTIPADATTVKYDDAGNANGRWAEPASPLGPVVSLVDKFRASDASTNPSKAYYNYARPFRWSTDVSILPTLEPVKKSDADAFGDGGYPSGHTNAAWLASYALAYSAPERFQELLTNASEIGNSRIVAGMHSPADVIGGRMMSTGVSAAVLNNPANATLKAQARANAAALLATPGTGADPYADHAVNAAEYLERLTYGLPRTGDTTLPVVVPKGAEVLIESRLPYLSADQRRWVLQSTGLGSGYALLDDAEGWGRLNLYAAADGYSAFDTDVTVNMDATAGGFSAADTWRNDIDGAGSLTKQGTGALTLTGANSFAGGMTVENGTVTAASATALGTGSLTLVDGVLSESVAAPVLVPGNLTLQSAGELDLTVGANTPALSVGGVASFDGALSVALASGFVPADDLVIATFGTLGAGKKFASVRVDGLPAGYTPTIEIRDGAVHLVNATPVLGALTAGTPAITGSAVAGEVLTVTPGTWGPAPVTLAYQWFRGSTPIDGATRAEYSATAADVGQVLTATVTGSKTGFAPQTRAATTAGAVVAALSISDSSVKAGDPISVSGKGFTPGETVRIELRSTPVVIGTVTADQRGAFSARVFIPADAVGGAHTIVAIGSESAITVSVAINVTALAVTPISAAARAAAGVLASTGGTLPFAVLYSALGLLVLGAGALVVRARMTHVRRSGAND
ncbi:phosphatase PAP2 family protein [Conyzicola sp.]|uniref:acid phosphatase n=1 Tax=Conyzicola sp. TaxID=1969404 RepID=UPI00398984EF